MLFLNPVIFTFTIYSLFHNTTSVCDPIENITWVHFTIQIFGKQQNEEIEDDKDYFEVTPAFIESWETVFAMTIHKSQGSEFNEVLVILPKKKENRLLTRELVYTGITRAKDCAFIQTSEEVLYKAVNQQVDRVSGLKDRILNNN